ncbi:MAG: SPFH domain-containing protein [Tateyamaria sp.]|nr:SPFH domain-containing protein [Tateyamaria sp.]
MIFRDPEFGPVRLRTLSIYSVKIKEPADFLVKIFSTNSEFIMDEVSFQFRKIIVLEMSRSLAKSGIPVMDKAANTRKLGQIVNTEITSQIAIYKLMTSELYIENISLQAAKVLERESDASADLQY